jgi:hypothetical protein
MTQMAQIRQWIRRFTQVYGHASPDGSGEIEHVASAPHLRYLRHLRFQLLTLQRED